MSPKVKKEKVMDQKDRYLYAIASMLFGIIAVVAWLFPVIGFPTSVAGLALGFAGKKSSRKNLAQIGIVLSIIGLVLSIANAAYGAYLGYKGLLVIPGK